MTRNEWLSIVNKIDDKYINELADYQLQKNQANEKKTSRKDEVVLKPQYVRLESSMKFPFKKAAIAAAVVCVAAAGVFMRVNKQPQTSSANDSAVVSSGGVTSGGTSETSVLPVPKNLILNMDLPKNTPSELSAVKLTLRKWDKAFMEDLFLKGKEIVEKNEYDCQLYPDEKFYSYDTKDQISVFFEPGRFCFEDEGMSCSELSYAHISTYGKYDYLASDEELSAFSREDAVTRVNEVLDKLGIENYGEPKIIPIKADFANEMLSALKGRPDKNGVPFDFTRWTADDEVYILRYPLVYENVELPEDGLIATQEETVAAEPSYIDATVSKDKIIKIWGNGIYTEECEIINKIPVNYNADQALEKLKKYYSELLLDNPVTYYKCKLVYIPTDGTYDNMTVNFTPAWEFYGYSTSDESGQKHQLEQYFFVDTGFRYIEH